MKPYRLVKKARPIVKEALDNNLSLSEKVPDWIPLEEKLKPFHETIIDKASEATSTMGGWLVSSLSSATKGTIGFFISLFIMFYAMFYFLIHGPKLILSLASLIPLSEEDRTEVMSRGLTVTRASMKGIVIVGVIQGVLVGLAFWTWDRRSSILGKCRFSSFCYSRSRCPIDLDTGFCLPAIYRQYRIGCRSCCMGCIGSRIG